VSNSDHPGSAGILPAVVCILLTTFDNSREAPFSLGRWIAISEEAETEQSEMMPWAEAGGINCSSRDSGGLVGGRAERDANKSGAAAHLAL